MKKSEILELLCSYDELNINGIISEVDGIEIIESHKKTLIRDKRSCYCDNCFTGKTKLAEYILKSNELLESAANQLQDFEENGYNNSTQLQDFEENGYNNSTAMKIYKHLGID